MIVRRIDRQSISDNNYRIDDSANQQPTTNDRRIELLSQSNNTFSKRRQMYRRNSNSLKVEQSQEYSLQSSPIRTSLSFQMPSRAQPLSSEVDISEVSQLESSSYSSPFLSSSSSFSSNMSSQSNSATPTHPRASCKSHSHTSSLSDSVSALLNFRFRPTLLLVILSLWVALLSSCVSAAPSGHSISSLHRHHHPSHPHAQSVAQYQSSYASQARYGIQADQAPIVGMRHTDATPSSTHSTTVTVAPTTTTTSTTPPLSTLLESSTRRTSSSDRSVRRVDPRGHPNHLSSYLARRQQQQQQHVLNSQMQHRVVSVPNSTTTSSTTTSTTSTTTSRPEVSRFPNTHCPRGPPTSWQGKLDVAAKAYLAPVVLYGQLISLSEDYGGRIAATFRLLKTVKPEMSVLNHSEIAEKLNDSRFDETHVKLYFVRNTTEAEANQQPFCAHAMPSVFQELKTAERYILFTYPQVLSSRGYTLPVHKNGNTRSHQVISLVTFAPPEVHSRTSSRMVRKVLCQHCGKF